MKTVAIAWAMLRARSGSSVLHVVLLGLGLGAFGFLLLARAQLDAALTRDVQGIDAVVGAKGSPMQLILSSVLHVDVPAGNVPLAEVNKLAQQPLVAEVLPVSLGDNWGGYRIVGTQPRLADWYGSSLAQGRLFGKPLEAVLGFEVAARTQTALGSQFTGNHGLGQGGEAHTQAPYTVVGTLSRCGCVLDRLILTATESVWAVHDKTHAADEADAKAIALAMADQREVTAALVRYKSPLAAVSFVRWVNQNTGMQAASPAWELSRLFKLLGVGTAVLHGFAWVLLAVACASVWLAMAQHVHERRADWAMLRLLGASPSRLCSLLLTQLGLLAAVGTALAVLLAAAAAVALQAYAAQAGTPVGAPLWPGTGTFALQLVSLVQGLAAHLWPVPLAAGGIALVAGALPLWQLYRVDASDALAAPR